MESLIDSYITKDLVRRPELLPLKPDTPLIDFGILDSLSLLTLVVFLEQQFGVTVKPEELVPKNFKTIKAICEFLRNKKAV